MKNRSLQILQNVLKIKNCNVLDRKTKKSASKNNNDDVVKTSVRFQYKFSIINLFLN